MSLPVDIYSLPGWSLVTQIGRLCLHFRAEAEPLDMGSQADPGNQSPPGGINSTLPGANNPKVDRPNLPESKQPQHPANFPNSDKQNNAVPTAAQTYL